MSGVKRASVQRRRARGPGGLCLLARHIIFKGREGPDSPRIYLFLSPRSPHILSLARKEYKNPSLPITTPAWVYIKIPKWCVCACCAVCPRPPPSPLTIRKLPMEAPRADIPWDGYPLLWSHGGGFRPGDGHLWSASARSGPGIAYSPHPDYAAELSGGGLALGFGHGFGPRATVQEVQEHLESVIFLLLSIVRHWEWG